MLKLDGRTVRGRIWKEVLTSGKPLKQGVLWSKKTCSSCNETPDAEKEVIECMSCHSFFHITCLIKPVTEEFLKVTAENPNVWWHCFACLSCKSNDAVISSQEGQSTASSDVIMTSTLLNFKKDILKLVGETMESKLKTFSDAIAINNKKKIVNTPQNYVKSAASPSVPEQNVWGVTSGSTNNAHTEQTFPKKLEKHILLIEPTNSESMSKEETVKLAVSSINSAIPDTNVEICNVKKSGMVAIGFKDSKAMKEAEQKFGQNKQFSSTFSTREPRKLQPKVTIYGINEVLFENCDTGNRDDMKAVLLDDILNRNSAIKILSERNGNFLNVVMIQKVMPSVNTVSYNAVLKMSSEMRKALHDNGDKIYVSLNRCKISDRFHIKQCYHCQKPGHISKDCRDKKENKPPTCFYCSGEHPSKQCHTKDTGHCCINCMRSNNQDMIDNARSHTAASNKCPVLQAHSKNVRDKTEDWKGKN